jgi:transposase-like protein
MPETKAVLEEVLREGAQRLLQAALETEILEHLDRYRDLRDDRGRRRVVRNGSHPAREILSGIGPIPLRQPRIDDRVLAGIGETRFSSSILPRFMRRAPSIDAVVPVLYLKGISTNDFPTALEALLGPGAKGLSATTVVRLKDIWTEEYREWAKRDLGGKSYVYVWADGVYCQARLEDERSCLLVVMGADSFGNKELLAVVDGIRESKQSWRELLLDLKHRGLNVSPKLAICDGALGFQAAAAELWPSTRIQRCWVHKTGNVLDKLPKAVQSSAKRLIHEQYMAPTREDAVKAHELFVATYSPKYPKAVECLTKDFENLFAFYDFPAEHWLHVRTTNPIESTFATVRLRHRKTKGNGTREATLTMVFKLCREAEKTWRKLDGSAKLSLVVAGRKFKDGELIDDQAA